MRTAPYCDYCVAVTVLTVLLNLRNENAKLSVLFIQKYALLLQWHRIVQKVL